MRLLLKLVIAAVLGFSTWSIASSYPPFLTFLNGFGLTSDPGNQHVRTTARHIDHLVEVGDLLPGKEMEVSFNLQNNSKTPWHITEVRTSCGCTKVQFSKRDISPGESVLGTVVIRPGAANEDKTFFSIADVYLADGQQPHHFRFEGQIRPPLSVQPAELILESGLDKEELTTVSFQLLSRLGNDGTPTLTGQTPD